MKYIKARIKQYIHCMKLTFTGEDHRLVKIVVERDFYKSKDCLRTTILECTCGKRFYNETKEV